MAFRMASLTLASIVAVAASADVCPGVTNELISSVTSLSPKCFEMCPQVCRPMDSLITEYMESFDAEAIKSKVCANPEPFSCFFNHMDKCRTVLAAGSQLGVELPMSQEQLDAQCGTATTTAAAEATTTTTAEAATTEIATTSTASEAATTSLRGGGHHDAQATTTSREVTSAAAGRSVWAAAVSMLVVAGLAN